MLLNCINKYINYYPIFVFLITNVLPISQVTMMLTELDTFLKRVEPEIDGITGDEKDTASFMKLMRVFNEVFIYKIS